MDQPVDFKEARRIARLIAQYGKAMEDSVPPDIADAFHSQVKAVRKSSGKLSTDSNVRDVTDPVYSDKAQARRKKLDEYECG
ncbi:hypothetical protein [Nonomuraea sp. KM88]|uniref:hypothetical protein n=1 Tax=Nonomuraea sp. KM88 TaxID=3457427 RepID=UPI003FCD406A